MIVALALPRLLDRRPDRPFMLAGGAVLGAGLLVGHAMTSLTALVPVWFLLGAGSSLIQTPAGRLLMRSAHEPDRPAIYAAQFALSHACWLVTYLIAGWLGSALGLPVALTVLAVVALAGTATARLLWPAHTRANWSTCTPPWSTSICTPTTRSTGTNTRAGGPRAAPPPARPRRRPPPPPLHHRPAPPGLADRRLAAWGSGGTARDRANRRTRPGWSAARAHKTSRRLRPTERAPANRCAPRLHIAGEANSH